MSITEPALSPPLPPPGFGVVLAAAEKQAPLPENSVCVCDEKKYHTKWSIMLSCNLVTEDLPSPRF